MIKHVLLVTAFAVGLTSFAAAQAAPSMDAPPVPMDQAAPPPPPPGNEMPPMPSDMPPPPPGKGPRSGDHRGPPPPRMTKGVEIRLGKDMGIRIECGDEPMAACLAAAKPLTDKIPNLKMPPAPPVPDGAPTLPAN